jgi:hypothetical protein
MYKKTGMPREVAKIPEHCTRTFSEMPSFEIATKAMITS